MSYRSHHNALYLENVTLRAENARLREEVQHAQVAYEAARELRELDREKMNEKPFVPLTRGGAKASATPSVARMNFAKGR